MISARLPMASSRVGRTKFSMMDSCGPIHLTRVEPPEKPPFNWLRFDKRGEPFQELLRIPSAVPVADPFAEVENLLRRWPVQPSFRIIEPSHDALAHYEVAQDTVVFRGRHRDPKITLRLLIHEILHATGTDNRLRRQSLRDFLFHAPEEEAAVYLGTALVEHRLGATHIEETTDEWIGRLAELNDEARIRDAVREASRAADYLMNQTSA